MPNVNLQKHIREGWTVGDFISDLEPTFNMIQRKQSHIKPFTKDDLPRLKTWCKDNQPYYKKYVPDVYNYFKSKLTM